MAINKIRGEQIKDESIESIDIASGSIKAGELSNQAIADQTTITSTDATNDYLLIWDATDSSLKKVSPTNLGIGGSGSPAGSDTQLQYNDDSSFGAVSGATTDGTNITFGDTALLVGQDIIHDGDSDTFIRFTDNIIVLNAADKSMFKADPDGTGQIIINNGNHDIDFIVKSDDETALFYTDADTNRVGIGTTSPDNTLHVKSSGTTHIKIESDAGYEAALKLKSGTESSAYVWQPGSTSDLRFYVNGADRMHLDNDGNIGLGTTTPAHTLSVVGTISATGNLDITGSVIASSNLRLQSGGSIVVDDSDTAAFTVDSSGHVTKIGQDSPSGDQVLTWDGDNSRAVWSASGGGSSYTAGTGLVLSSTEFSINDSVVATLSGSTFTGNITIGGDTTVNGNIVFGNSAQSISMTNDRDEAVAAISIDTDGEITKIGQDTPADGESLVWDDANSKAVWKYGGRVLNSVYAQNSDVGGEYGGAITTICAFDDTKPQFEEGDVILTAPSITTVSNDSKIRVIATAPCCLYKAAYAGVLFLHRSDEGDCDAAVAFVAGSNWMHQTVTIQYEMESPGADTAIEYKLLAGVNSALNGNALDINGDGAGSRLFGGASYCSILVEEILPVS